MTEKIKLIYIDEQEEENRDFQRFAKDHFDLSCIIPNENIQECVSTILGDNPDMLIVDFNLSEYKSDVCYSGIDLVDAIHKIKFDLPCLILTSHTDDAMDQSLDPNTIHYKGELNDEKANNLLLRTIERNVIVYKNKIEDAINEHSQLLEKLATEEGLTSTEESKLTELDEYLEKVTDKSYAIPSNLKKALLSGQLDELIDQTKLLLEKTKRDL